MMSDDEIEKPDIKNEIRPQTKVWLALIEDVEAQKYQSFE